MLADDPRDYAFRPADPERARTLSEAQIRSFNDRGYVTGLSLGDADEASSRRGYFDALLDKLLAYGDGRDTYSLMGYQTRCAGLYDIVTDPRILDVIEDLLGPDFVCWSSHLFAKPGVDARAVPPHQDATCWPLHPSSSVTVWLAVDDATVDNACLEVLPGSHRGGALAWEKFDGPVVAATQADALQQVVTDLPSHGALVPVELRAGQFSVHCDLTVHGSRPNTSGRRRYGLAIRYSRTDVRPLDPNWGQHAILVRGEDRYGHWTLHSRPESEDVESWRRHVIRKQLMARKRARAAALAGAQEADAVSPAPVK